MRSQFGPDFRRFLPAWLVFGSSVSLAAFVLLAPPSLWGLVDPGDRDDAPPMLVFMLSVFVYLGALVLGLVVVPFRRLLIGPRAPFFKRGFLAVAALPLIGLTLPGLLWIQRAYLTLAAEVFLVISALFFVVLGRLFGAFDDVERRISRPKGDAGVP